MKTKGKRFDHLLREALNLKQTVELHGQAAKRARELCLKAAYRCAKALVDLQTNWHNELLDFCKTQQTNIDEWIVTCLAPILDLGGNPQDLLRSVEQGMTVKDWLGPRGMTYHIREKAKQRAAGKTEGASKPSVTETMEGMSYKARYGLLLKEHKSQAAEIRDLHRQITVLLNENERLMRVLRKLERTIEQAQKQQESKRSRKAG